MLSRRNILMGAALAALLPAAAPAFARNDPLLEDILYGVTDAVIRDHIRRHYDRGRWDGRYWWYEEVRYSVPAYRRYWIDDYHRRHDRREARRYEREARREWREERREERRHRREARRDDRYAHTAPPPPPHEPLNPHQPPPPPPNRPAYSNRMHRPPSGDVPRGIDNWNDWM